MSVQEFFQTETSVKTGLNPLSTESLAWAQGGAGNVVQMDMALNNNIKAGNVVQMDAANK